MAGGDGATCYRPVVPDSPQHSDKSPTASGETSDASIPVSAEDPEGLIERLFPLVEMTRRDRWIEICSAVLLSLATLASAWSAYQATRWGGIQATKFSQASATRTESVRASTDANTFLNIDVGMFVDYASALTLENDDLAEFLFDRFRDEFEPAVVAWLATDPLVNEEAPAVPFQMDEYVLADQEKADELDVEASELFQEAREANQRADNYILTTVLFASVLFFGGVATKFQSVRVKVVTLAFGALVFLGAVGLLISQPRSIGF